MKIQNTLINGTEIRFSRQPAKSDRKHLLVVFSGFRPHGTYDFGGRVFNDLNTEIIWIDDTFNDHYSYYMLAYGGQDIAPAINLFIENIAKELSISKDDCTLAGFSKGGSAALYYLARFGYKNAIVSVPQFNISQYVKKNWPGEVEAMFGSKNSELECKYETVIESVIKDDHEANKNIYLITSPADSQFYTEISPNLHLLEKYENFNRITSKTPLIQKHDEVTRYNIPSIIALISLLTDGIAPKFGNVINGSEQKAAPTDLEQGSNSIGKGEGEIERIYVDGNLLFLEGFGFFRGAEATSYGHLKTTLILENESNSIKIPLGQDKNSLINTRNYKNRFIDYSYAKFATMKYAGINLDALPDGRYRASLKLSDRNGRVEILNAISAKNFNKLSICDNYSIKLISEKSEMMLVKDSFRTENTHPYFFEMEKFSTLGSTLYIQGYFIPRGFDISSWSSIAYYIRFTETSSNKSRIFPLAVANRDNANTKSGDYLNNQNKAYFATKKYQGCNLSLLDNGDYDVEVVALFDGKLISHKLPERLSIGLAQDHHKAKVAVIGSCVTRDLFNSKINPGWKKNFSLVDSFYQMSLISLMSNSVSTSLMAFDDLSNHDRDATLEDFKKDFLNRIAVSKPNYIVVDLFADSRFDVIKFESGYITDNSWKIGNSRAYSDLSGFDRISPNISESEYFDLFAISVDKFKSFIRDNLPDATIILNSCRASNYWRSLEGFGKFRSDVIHRQNARWRRLEEIFISALDPIVITSSDRIFSDPEHPWGKGPVHYESIFYKETSKKLCSAIYPTESVEREFSIVSKFY